jgi:hypothetical protein
VTERWERELGRLKTLEAPDSMHTRMDRGPAGDGAPPDPGRRQRLVAAVVALSVFAAAGAFALRAFEGDAAPGQTDTPSPTTASPSPPEDEVLIVNAIADGQDPVGITVTVSIGGERIRTWRADGSASPDAQDGVRLPFNGEDYVPVLAGTPLVIEGNATDVSGTVAKLDPDRGMEPFDAHAGVLPDLAYGSRAFGFHLTWDEPGFHAARTVYVPLRLMAPAVPDVIGLGDQPAFLSLYEDGLTTSAVFREVEGVEQWRVASMDPPPGTAVSRDTVVHIVVATNVTPLPDVATSDRFVDWSCPIGERASFGGPHILISIGGDAHVTAVLGGFKDGDRVFQVQWIQGDPPLDIWHWVRAGKVIAVVDYDTLDGVACAGSGVAGT